MTTIRRTALLGLLVLGVGVLGCTAPGDQAQHRQDEAQKELAARAGITIDTSTGQASGGPAAAGGGGAAGNDPVKLGQAVALQNACAACHTTDGKASVGPTWKGLAGHDVDLVDGSKVKADDAYLKESILQPNAKVVKGFAPNVMPQTFSSLKPEQIDQLIAYINSLK